MQNTKYPHIIQGQNFNVMLIDEIESLRKVIGKMPQPGIKYFGDKCVALSSNSLQDILDIMANGGVWAHRKNPVRVEAGWQVFVIPSGAAMKNITDNPIGIKFEAVGPSYQDNTAGLSWA